MRYLVDVNSLSFMKNGTKTKAPKVQQTAEKGGGKDKQLYRIEYVRCDHAIN